MILQQVEIGAGDGLSVAGNLTVAGNNDSIW